MTDSHDERAAALIREWRGYQGMNQSDFAEAAGLSRQMIGLYERGQASPSWHQMGKIMDAIGVSALEFFQGPPTTRRIDERQPELTILRENDTDSPREVHSIELPLYSDIPAGGWGGAVEIEGTHRVLRHLVERDGFVVVRVNGLSMHPEYKPDDLILVDTNRTKPKSGDPIVALYHGETTFKRYRVINRMPTLVPDNPEFPPMEIDDPESLVVLGVVTDLVHRKAGRGRA